MSRVLLRYRQGREGHPNPARVICADLLTHELDADFSVRHPMACFDTVCPQCRLAIQQTDSDATL